MSRLLEVVDLSAEYRTSRGRVRAVDNVSFGLEAGESLAIVGESGSGKTATALALLRLLPDPPGRITAGQVLVRGQDVLDLHPADMSLVRGRELAMIFQEPGSALNPVMTVGQQVAEAVVAHGLDREEGPRGARRGGGGSRSVRRAVLAALAEAGIPSPERVARQYPHELSGGLKQRVMIAMALACGPSVLIADEPTTALDVTVQARLLDLLAYLQAGLGLGLLLITHDLGIVARTADRVAVMYAGRLVETAPVAGFFERPAHPYSRGLLEAARMSRASGGGLRVIDGSVPDLLDLPPGCRFAPRCPVLGEARRPGGPRRGLAARLSLACEAEQPPTTLAGSGHTVACWLAEASP